MRLRLFDQYADKLIERFPDLKLNIHDRLIRINGLWNALESRFIDYLDEDFDRILQGKKTKFSNFHSCRFVWSSRFT